MTYRTFGKDDKAVVVRHGPVVLAVKAKSDGTASDGLDWAIQHVDDFGADTFIWDSDGIGLGLAREVERQLGPRNVGPYRSMAVSGPRIPMPCTTSHRIKQGRVLQPPRSGLLATTRQVL